METIEDFCVPILLYLSFQNYSPQGLASNTLNPDNSRDTAAGYLTPRQIQILRCKVESKTNHELANEMGFSVFGIRQEIMHINQALAFSNR